MAAAAAVEDVRVETEGGKEGRERKAGEGKEGGEEEGVRKKDYYATLGVSKDATEKEITVAYRKLALKYHPDRNRGSTTAEENFKIVNEAYAVLSDPSKRRQYDLLGEEGAAHEFESVDVENLGGVGRVFGAMMSKLGVPIPTQIAQTTLHLANEICTTHAASAAAGGLIEDPRVATLHWGIPRAGRVERQHGVFFQLTVSQADVDRGFVLTCRSSNKSKFKLIVFDERGAVRLQEESTRSELRKDMTVANMYFTHFDAYRLPEPFPMHLMDPDLRDVPEIFFVYDGFQTARANLGVGTHLLCIYGDNFLSKAAYVLTALRTPEDAATTARLLEADERVAQQKTQLEDFKTEFMEAKKAYEAAVERLEGETKALTENVQSRAEAYEAMIQSGVAETQAQQGAIIPPEIDINGDRTPNAPGIAEGATDLFSSISGSFTSMFSAGPARQAPPPRQGGGGTGGGRRVGP